MLWTYKGHEVKNVDDLATLSGIKADEICGFTYGFKSRSKKKDQLVSTLCH